MKWPHRFILPHRLLLLQMITLEERRKIAQVALIHSIMRGEMSSKHITESINIRIPHHRTRNNEFLSLPNRSTNYAKFEPINHMLITYNDFYRSEIRNVDYYKSINPICDTFLIDFNESTNNVKKRMTDFMKNRC